MKSLKTNSKMPATMNEKSLASSTANASEIPTAIMTPKTVELIERYQVYARKTAEGFLELAITYATAKNELDCVQFKIFADTIGVNTESATSTRLLKIAEEQGRFLPYLQQMPSAYTTLYELARLPVSDFESLVQDGKIQPTMTGAELQILIKKPSSGSNLNHRQANNAHIAFEYLQPEDKIRLWTKLTSVAQEFSVKIELAPQVTKELSDLQKTLPGGLSQILEAA